MSAEQIKTLCDLGFTRSDVIAALKDADNNTEKAATILISALEVKAHEPVANSNHTKSGSNKTAAKAAPVTNTVTQRSNVTQPRIVPAVLQSTSATSKTYVNTVPHSDNDSTSKVKPLPAGRHRGRFVYISENGYGHVCDIHTGDREFVHFKNITQPGLRHNERKEIAIGDEIEYTIASSSRHAGKTEAIDCVIVHWHNATNIALRSLANPIRNKHTHNNTIQHTRNDNSHNSDNIHKPFALREHEYTLKPNMLRCIVTMYDNGIGLADVIEPLYSATVHVGFEQRHVLNTAVKIGTIFDCTVDTHNNVLKLYKLDNVIELNTNERNKEYFIINEKIDLQHEESESVELKEIQSQNSQAKHRITDLADKYVVGYLNSKPGSILFGVHDTGYVCGVKLEYRERDSLHNEIQKRLQRCRPAIQPTQYTLQLKPVYYKIPLKSQHIADDKYKALLLHDLYVVHLHVHENTTINVYESFGSQYCPKAHWIHRGTSTVQMKSDDVQQLIQQRMDQYNQRNSINIDDKISEALSKHLSALNLQQPSQPSNTTGKLVIDEAIVAELQADGYEYGTIVQKIAEFHSQGLPTDNIELLVDAMDSDSGADVFRHLAKRGLLVVPDTKHEKVDNRFKIAQIMAERIGNGAFVTSKGHVKIVHPSNQTNPSTTVNTVNPSNQFNTLHTSDNDDDERKHPEHVLQKTKTLPSTSTSVITNATQHIQPTDHDSTDDLLFLNTESKHDNADNDDKIKLSQFTTSQLSVFQQLSGMGYQPTDIRNAMYEMERQALPSDNFELLFDRLSNSG